jgi:BirA family biotin operon repressor/biotin-[acetyl-CoA-carboxylase] ligase
MSPPDLDRICRETFVARAEHHARLASTNDRAVRLAAQSPGELPLLVLADRQTAGRGRGDNRWWTGEGSLAMSLLLDGATAVRPPEDTPLLALAAALAVVETVAPVLGEHTVGIHWPNDVYVDHRKLAGVLIEVLPDRRTVVGIGLNTNNTLADGPAELQQKATTLRDLTGSMHHPTTLLLDLLGRLERDFELLATASERIAGRVDRLCLQRGHTLTLRQGDREITGRCQGIAPDGALVLDTPSAGQRFYSGVITYSQR